MFLLIFARIETLFYKARSSCMWCSYLFSSMQRTCAPYRTNNDKYYYRCSIWHDLFNSYIFLFTNLIGFFFDQYSYISMVNMLYISISNIHGYLLVNGVLRKRGDRGLLLRRGVPQRRLYFFKIAQHFTFHCDPWKGKKVDLTKDKHVHLWFSGPNSPKQLKYWVLLKHGN